MISPSRESTSILQSAGPPSSLAQGQLGVQTVHVNNTGRTGNRMSGVKTRKEGGFSGSSLSVSALKEVKQWSETTGFY
jgi:hypothetical protein